MNEYEQECTLILMQKGLEKMPEIPENIKKLDIRRNKLSRLSFSENSSLEYLDASDNLIKSLKGVSGLKNLQVFDAGYNLIKKIPKLELPALKELYLMSNDIKKMKNIHFSNLLKIDLANNEIKTLRKFETPEISEAYFGANKISKIENISDFSHLKILDLQFNKLKELDCSLLPSGIEVLLVNDNRKLKVIKNIENLKFLKILGLKNTKVIKQEISKNIEIW